MTDYKPSMMLTIGYDDPPARALLCVPLDDYDALAADLAEAERALREICAVDKAAPGRKDCDIWADMLAIASAAAYGRDSFMSLDELIDSAPAQEKRDE